MTHEEMLLQKQQMLAVKNKHEKEAKRAMAIKKLYWQTRDKKR